MHRLLLVAVPRGIFAAFVLVCMAFFLAALSAIVPGSFSQLTHFYPRLLGDSQLFTVLGNTAILFFISIVIQITICTAGTCFVTSASPTVMAILLIPYATGVVAPAFAFLAFKSTAIGPLNIPLDNSILAQRIIIALIDTWQWIGILLVAVFFQVNQIPRSYFQLADLEGLKTWTRWRLIIWPQIKIVLLLYIVFRALDWLRKADVVQAIYDRGPASSLQTIAMYIKEVSFQTAIGSSAGIQDLYGNFLALLQLVILITASIYIFRKRLTNKLYNDGSLIERVIVKIGNQSWLRYIYSSIFWIIIISVVVIPIIWIASLSLQQVSVTEGGSLRSQLLPTKPTFDVYRAIWNANADVLNGKTQEIAGGIVYSLINCSISAVIACVVAFSAAFIFIADSKSENLRAPIMAFVLSIFFFPPVIAIHALNKLSNWFTWFSGPSAQLVLLYTANAFVLSFILFLIRCMTIPRADFEQTLLEKQNRTSAFWIVYIKHEIVWIIFIFVLAFSSCWSEFYISTFITASQDIKPFSVILEMNHGQYNSNYSVFAAGAIISLLICIISVTIPFIIEIIYRLPLRNRALSGQDSCKRKINK